MVNDTPVFLYDGDCAFCSACARFADRWIKTRATITAWQFADLATLGVTVAECDVAVQWVVSDGTHTSGPVAIADLLKSSRLWWQAIGFALALKPVLWVAWPIYRWVSVHRDKLPGGTATCALPQAERDAR